jgi:nitroreductase
MREFERGFAPLPNPSPSFAKGGGHRGEDLKIMLKDLILKNRSYRRFYQEVPVEIETLKELVDLARLAHSARNLQALKFFLSADPQQNARIFPHLSWAGYLKDWPGPAEGERPSAYILILNDKEIGQSMGPDEGIAALSILLGATERGLGGCIIASIDREKVARALGLPEQYEIRLAVPLGKPREKVALEAVRPDGDIKYWRDGESIHHVPKRSLEEIILT